MRSSLRPPFPEHTVTGRTDSPADLRRVSRKVRALVSRITTNIPALRGLHRLGKNQADLSTRLERLSTGLQINNGKDNPSGLIAAEVLRSEMTGINRAV